MNAHIPRLFALEGLTIHDSAVRSSYCIAIWNRLNRGGGGEGGRVEFIFPVTVFSSSFKVQKLRQACVVLYAKIVVRDFGESLSF